MTIAELAFRFISGRGDEDFTGAKISRVDILPEDIEMVKSFLGKKYRLKDKTNDKAFIFDLSNARIEKNTLIFSGEKPNFYRE